MDRETFLAALRKGPIRVTMNDGSQYNIQSTELCVVDQIAAHALYQEDGVWKTRILSLVCMISIEPLTADVHG